MRARLALPLLLVLAACDSTDGPRLDADFYVGTWTLVSLSDGTGDRSAEVDALLDDLRVVFRSDDTFTLTVDFAPAVNTAGQADVSFSGDYEAQPDLSVLLLSVVVSGQTVTPGFQADADSETRVDLTAPAVIIRELLGPLEIDFEGNVVLGLQKQ